jgi:hypothetical protein
MGVTWRNSFLLLATSIVVSMHSTVLAQDSTNTRCNDLPVYRLLDFWVGEWDVFVGEEKVGFNHIEKTLDGCAVFEHWVDMAGNEGKSLFFVSDSGKWKQVWVTGRASRPGGVKESTPRWANGSIERP